MIKRLSLILALAVAIPFTALKAGETFRNPVIPGFHPDPSVCRVGDDYYLVTSSFEWFPGIPIFHSRDLMNWEQLGHVLTRPSQLAMNEGMKHSQGLWAPTIRHHDGVFYVICTAQSAGGNFYVTATDPKGPWSEPVFLKDAPGIDPSLFFDDDGTCWYTGSINGTPEKDLYLHEDRIYIQQLDLKKGELVGERRIICNGQAINAPYAEAPHLYKINGKYYLMIAEGGTWEDHSVTVFTADHVMGPYSPGITNPVMTHRHLGHNIDITTVGHADLVQSGDGRWWAVLLGVRPLNGYNMLGRETFLTPVEFQNGWPVFNPGVGRVLAEEKATGLCPGFTVPKTQDKDEFDSAQLNPCWCFLRTPYQKWYTLSDGKLRISLRKEKVSDLVNPSLIARRVEHFNFTAQTQMEFSPSQDAEEAGMIIMQNGGNNYRLVVKREGKKTFLLLLKTLHNREETVASIPWKGGQTILKLEAKGLEYQFRAVDGKGCEIPVGDIQDASVNSTDVAGGFIGPFIGMYASSNGKDSSSSAAFDYFEYAPVNNKD